MFKKNLISLILISIAIVIGIIAYPFLPDTIAIQFGADNNPSNAASKLLGLSIFPAAMIFLLLTRKNAKTFVHKSNIFEVDLINLISQFIFLGIQIIIILYALDPSVYRFNISQIGKVAVGIVFIIVGNYLYRAKRSYGYGIKNRWTLSNERVWKQAHQFSSVIFIFAGIVTVLINIISIATEYTYVVLGGGVVICYIVSFVYYRKVAKEA